MCQLMSPLRGLVLCTLLVWGLPSFADEGKSLHWAAVTSTAQLDADGRLHVRERQEIVFNGDWNGGFRRFRIASGQDLELHGVLRIDAEGREIPLTEGDSDRVDHFERDGSIVRWRSRLSTDPPFAAQHMTYVLDYTLSRIVEVDETGTYTLNHDFGFTDRDGVIERMQVDLQLDPQWQELDGAPLTAARSDLSPGATVILTVRMRHSGATPPAAVWFPPSRTGRGVLVALVLAAVGTLAGIFLYREAQLDRFRPLPSLDVIDEAWLQANLFRFLPEEAGAVWDGYIGAPEVAAILARLVAEGKLQTEVKIEKFLFLKTSILKLRLTDAGVRGKRSYEATLVQKLFVKGGRETDTEKIRAHYKKTGFDPAAEIRKELETSLRKKPELADTRPAPPRRPLIIAFLACALMILLGLPSQPDPVAAGLAILVVSAGTAVISVGGAAIWRMTLYRLWIGALLFMIPPLIPTAVLAALCFTDALSGFLRPDWYLLIGLAGLAVTLFALALRAAMSRDGPQRLEIRQRLAAARRYLVRELQQPQPRLRDEWFPYVVAFNLGSLAEHWFRAFGAASQSVAKGSSSSGGWTSGGSASTEVSRGGGWTGGGGAFGGAGAGGSWVAAVGAVAAGVSQPSSSSSSGGGGGGSSSGGGGGGGW